MSQLNTLNLRDQLIQRITDFALDGHFVSDPDLGAVMREIWAGKPELGGLGSELWVEGAFPSEQAGETMGRVAERGVIANGLARQLDHVAAFPLTQKPYLHQLASLEAAHECRDAAEGQPAIVVTAGTGAGKTESFLFPMLERLWTQPPEPGGGVSAIILYPMNALVNDQVGRLDKWLEGQSRISFFHFTSETPENKKRADERNLPEATAARFRTRQQARGFEDRQGNRIEDGSGPQPQILVTNYSMLEYMLCRPQDAVFFGRNLRVLVLDEAHIYTGNLAAEITLLLRRVQMRCGRRPEQVLHIATSATIGGGAAELRPFAAKLFSKPEELVRLIEGTRCLPPLEVEAHEGLLPMSLAERLLQEPLPEEETLRINAEGGPEFATASADAWSRWASLLPHLAPASLVRATMEGGEHFVAPMLAEILRASPAIAKLQGILWANEETLRLPLPELAARLFGEDTDQTIHATRALLQLGAVSRDHAKGWPLVPNRVHYLMRGPEGLLLSLRRTASPPAYRALGSIGHVFSMGADPSACGEDDDHPLTLVRCTNSGWWGVAGRLVDGRLEPVPTSIVLHGRNEDGEELFDPENPDNPAVGRVRLFSLTEVEGSPWMFDPHTGRYSGDGAGVPLWEVKHCPLSGDVLGKRTVGWFAARARLQLSVLAETALAAMPAFPHPNNVWKPARGRRLLIFSDSRAEAARLGPRLTRQHEMQIFRAAVVQSLQSMTLGGDSADADELRAECERLLARLAAPQLSPVMRQSITRQLAEMQTALDGLVAGGSVPQWAETLQTSPIIQELLDPATAEGHDPRDENREQRWSRNAARVNETLTRLLGRELARRPTWPQTGLETLGLVEVVYPRLGELMIPPALLGTVPMQVAESLRQSWTDYLAALLDALRNQGCITLGDEDADDDYQFGGSFLGKHFSARDSYKRSMISLIGAQFDGERVSRRNAFTRDYLIACGLPRDAAVQRAGEVMQMAFDALLEAARTDVCHWLEVRDSSQTHGDHVVPSLRLRFPMLGLRRPAQLYRCENTGQVWPRSVCGIFPGALRSSLRLIEPNELDMDARLGRLRREYREWDGFRLGLWAEEHSAQLSPQENARLQDLFRDGMRNILSSTTTLELGIDIGGLSAVLLGNLPPGKANYLQRAGRAGRRADGSSAVLGFARPSAYEREVFLDFRRYLSRELRRPTVFLDRSAIVRRHAHAWLLGEFFRRHYLQGDHTGAMDAYGKMGPFTGAVLPPKWDSDAPAKPPLPDPVEHPLSTSFLDDLDAMATAPPAFLLSNLQRLWRNCPELETILAAGVQSLPGILQQVRQEFSAAFATWREDVTALTLAWSEVPATPPPSMTLSALRAQANAIFYQIRTLHQMTVIESLADGRVLPRYGFPIGLCKLHVQVGGRDPHTGRMVLREEDQFRLQRDSMMAMREYVPGSQLLVGGKIITSRGLLKHWTGAAVANESWGLRGRFKRTSSGYFDYSITSEEPSPPPNPSLTDRLESGEMIFPKSGFCTSASEPPRHGSDFEKVGSVEIYTLAFENLSACDAPQAGFGGIAGCTATYRHGGELLLLNSGADDRGFVICQLCGYADSEWHASGQGAVNLPNRFEWHSPLQTTARGRDRRCWTDGQAPVWRHQHLAARQTTHLLKLDFSHCVQPMSRELCVTLGQALRLAAAETLEQDSREIRVIEPVPDSLSGAYNNIILYDTLAGGSGHLAQLSHPSHPERSREWFRRTIELLTVTPAYPDSVRRREAMRRVLTSDMADEPMVPLDALDFLLRAQAADVPVEPAQAVVHVVPDDAWTLERLLADEPPELFYLWCPAMDVADLDRSSFLCQRCHAKPPALTPVILRHEQLPGGIAVGRWFARELEGGIWQVRLRKSHGNSPQLQISAAEYEALLPLAFIQPPD